jgi:hypothetical protein
MRRIRDLLQRWRVILRIARPAKPDPHAGSAAATPRPAVQGTWPKIAEFTRYSRLTGGRRRSGGTNDVGAADDQGLDRR